jgi:hypothetical protein
MAEFYFLWRRGHLNSPVQLHTDFAAHRALLALPGLVGGRSARRRLRRFSVRDQPAQKTTTKEYTFGI